MARQTGAKGKALIKSSEGWVDHVYNDNGHPAIGYGHRLRDGETFPDHITLEQGEEILAKDLAWAEDYVNANVPPECTQNQFDALVSWTYNVQNQPTALETMLGHGWDQVPVQMQRWFHAGGNQKLEDGLKARRAREAALFLLDD